MKFKADKKVTNPLKFKPIPEFNYLCLGKLVDVRVESNMVEKVNEKGQERDWEYAGHEIPQLVLEFKNVKHPSEKDEDFVERFYTHRERVIGSKQKNGDFIDDNTLENLYTAMFDRIKHIYDAYEGAPNFKALPDNIPEIDEKDAPPEERLKQFNNFFKFFADNFNKGKDEKTPIYKTNGKSITMTMKLVAEYKTKKYLAFPTFVGEGFIEQWKQGRKPTIELKPGETVTLKGSESKSDSSASATGEDVDSEVQRLINQQGQ